MRLSDRDKLLDELEAIEINIAMSEIWTVEVSKLYIRREEIKRLLKLLGRKDWF